MGKGLTESGERRKVRWGEARKRAPKGKRVARASGGMGTRDSRQLQGRMWPGKTMETV